MKNTQKGFSSVVVVVIIAVATLIIGGAYFYATRISKPKPASGPENIPAEVKLQTTNDPDKAGVNVVPAQTDETSDWETYRNDRYGFEIKFPKIPNYTFRKNNRDRDNDESMSKNIQFNYESDNSYKSIYIQELTGDIKEGIDKNKSADISQKISGYDAEIYLVPEGDYLGEYGDYAKTLVVVFKENRNFFIRISPNDSIIPEDFFGRILSTFKFVKDYGEFFNRYKVDDNFAGGSAPLNLKSDSEALKFKTRLTAAYQGTPNFAGHYTIDYWGCGSPCQRAAVIDHITGNVYFLPEVASAGFKFRKDSNLIVVNPTGETKETCEQKKTPICAPPTFYVFENNKFNEISLIK